MKCRQILAGMAVVAMLAAAPASAQSLADSLIAAYRNSNLLEQNRAVLRAADEDVAIAVANLRPTLEFVTEFSTRTSTRQGTGAMTPSGASRSLTVGLQAQLTLIDFGRGQLAREAAKASVLATRHALTGLEQDVLQGAINAHLDVRIATEAVSLQRATVRAISEELEAARQRFELNEVTRTDVALAEASLAAARSALAAAEGELTAAREGYKFATGQEAGQLRPPPALPSTAASLDAAKDIARRTHPDILQAQQQVTIGELNAQGTSTQRLGSVTAGATLGADFNNGPGGASNTSRSASANIRYARPIFQGGRLNADTRQANARRDEARAGLHQSVARVLQNVAVAWANIDVAQARTAASRQQVSAAESAFEGTREEARLGVRTTLDVLNAETDLLEARTSLLEAEASVQTATYSLLSAMGLLTVDHLGLGVPTYDPEAYFDAVRDAPVTSSQGEALDRVLRALNRD
jgi:outer membrane protein